jgi:energy-coupling factor transporter ATP-binding protein EcfA2
MVMEKIELVEVEDLSYWYPSCEGAALEGVTLGLAPGDFVLLAGASGSGKSTLCRALNGLVPHFYGGRMTGSVKVDGLDTRTAEVRDLARTVGMVFQDPENQMVTDNPVSEIAFGLENMGVERVQMLKRVEEVLASLRLSDLREKTVGELSGGQKQKVALASVLAMHPRVLVLDEPTSQLDPVSAEEFLSTLKSLNDELGLIVVLAEHRVERCFHFADRVVVLDSGRLAFEGGPREMAKWCRHRTWVPLPPITRLFSGGKENGLPLTVKEGRLRVAELAEKKGSGRPPGSLVDGSVPAAAPVGQALGPGLTQSQSLSHSKRHRTRNGSGSGPVPVIETTSLWHIYGDGTEALRGIDLAIEPGEFVAVVGENGSGKTTLVKHFNGLLRPTRGKVVLDGAATKGVEVARLARTCGMLGQDPNLQLVADTTRAELETSLRAMDISRDAWAGMIDETLEMLELARFADANPQDLSCGERERVALASVLVYRPKVLVLDEPTRGVDQGTKDRLAAYLKHYNDEGNTIILVTHDLEFAAECCRRVLMMGGGRVLADGDKHSVLADSLFFTTQYNKCFRGVADGVVTREEAAAVLEAIS